MRELKAVRDIISQLGYVMNQKQKHESIWIFFLLLLGSLLELASISIILPFIYVIMDMDTLMCNPRIVLLSEKYSFISESFILFGTVIAIILVYLTKNILLMFIQYRVNRFGCNYKKDVSTRMLSAYLHQPYIAYSYLNTADVLRGIYSDVEGSYNMLSTMLNMLADMMGLIAIGIYLFYKDAFIAIGMMILAAVCGILLYKGVRSKTKEMGFKQREISAKTYKIACQAIGGIKDIMVMNRRHQFEDEYSKMYEEKRKIDIIYNCFLALPTRTIETVFISGLALVIGIRYSMGVDNTKFLADLVVFAAASVKLMPYVARLMSNITQLIYMKLNIASVYNHLCSTAKHLKTCGQKTLQKYDFQESIRISNLEWRYMERGDAVLQNINLEIKKGESVAFIGASGSGKTTLADIILGLYVPQKGDVTVDGVSIFDIPDDWARFVGYVAQSVYLLDDTIRNNILFGKRGTDDELIWSALEQAQLKDFVMTLPEGLDTVVGERGIKFSGGQRQRIAVARALYYNPDILVLDEATSALDSETEEALISAIEALQGIKTLIIIAHRMSTIRNCDKIYEIKDGRAILRYKEELFGGKSIGELNEK